MYKFILLVVPLFYYYVLSFISLIVFSLGFYSDEIKTVGYFNGSIAYYSLFLFIFIGSTYLIWKIVPNKYKDLNFRLRHKKEILMISGLLLLFYFIPVLLYKPAFVNGLNRYQFTDLPYVDIFNIKLFLAILSFVWGAYASQEHKKLSKFTMLWIGFVLISFCYGEKSSGVIDSLIYFFCGYFLYRNKDIKFKTFFLLFLLFISFPFVLFIIQLFIINIPTSELSDAFLIRLARQGQVFWIAYEEFVNNNLRFENFGIFNYFSDELKGMKLIMYTFMPFDKYEAHSGSLAAGYPGILFFADNSLFSIIFMYATLSMLSILPFIVYFFILLRYRMHYLILFFIVFSMTVHLKIFQSGNIQLITNIKYIIFYFTMIILLFYLLSRKRRTPCELSETDK